MKAVDIIGVSILTFFLAVYVAQFIMRLLKIEKTPKKLWQVYLPAKKAFFYALLCIVGIILYMLKNGILSSK